MQTEELNKLEPRVKLIEKGNGNALRLNVMENQLSEKKFNDWNVENEQSTKFPLSFKHAAQGEATSKKIDEEKNVL